MEINILIEDKFKNRLTRKFLKQVASEVLKAENAGDNVEMGILITSQEKIKELNRDYRGKDEPTDVLAFQMITEQVQRAIDLFVMPPDDIRHLGEVVISYPQAIIQAREHKHPVKKEIAILLIHGILHLLGYDHEKTSDEKRMRDRETAILDLLTNKHIV